MDKHYIHTHNDSEITERQRLIKIYIYIYISNKRTNKYINSRLNSLFVSKNGHTTDEEEEEEI
jgi:hypothetical protein